jgi:hypothetical protein
MSKKRRSYCSMSKEQFLNPATGAFKRLDNTAWYIKKRDDKPCYFLNMNTKFQQMPDACFEATAAASPAIDVEVIKKDIAKFMEVKDVQS